MTAAAAWLILCATFILTCAAINHRDKKRATRRATTPPVALHVPTETPADAEWRRRLARWTAEDKDAS